jgi:starch-binding outer membrane protein, SusD/RagB family
MLRCNCIKMKKLIYSILTLCVVLFSSCNKEWMDVNPTDAVSADDIFKTVPNAWGAINGMHRNMYRQWGSMDQAGQSGIMIHMDMLGDDLVFASTANGWFLTTYRWLLHTNANASSVDFVWYFYYNQIGNANMIINNIDGAEGDPAQRNAIKGQAYAYRAWAHFQLVQLFGKRYDSANKPNNQLGVPYLVSNDKEGQPRATVEAVYEQIIKDLNEAINLLPENMASVNPVAATRKSHINKQAAKGLRARVALTMGDWATAAQFAGEARQNSSLMSHAQYREGFNKVSNPEWIWGSHQMDDQQTFFHSFFAFMSVNFNSSNIRANPKIINRNLYNHLSATDVRSQIWDPTGTDPTYPAPGTRYPYMNRKFIAQASGASVGDVVYMRAAEMFLIEAEAKARLGQDGPAADLLFTLMKTRDPEYIRTTLIGQALLEEILIQRRIELWGEGFRFLDLKRTNSDLDRRNSNHTSAVATNVAMFIEAGTNEWQWLIPQNELNANKAMVQNPL